MHNLKKTALSAAVATALGVATVPASADIIEVSFGGSVGEAWFTMINASGLGNLNNTDAGVSVGGVDMYGNRTPVLGTMKFNTATGTGTGSVNAFSFFGSGLASTTAVTFDSIGSNLVLGNMGFNWNNNIGIPVSIVLDASGFFGAMPTGLTTSDIIGGSTLAASDDFVFETAKGATYTLPMGPGPVVTTTWNTTDIGAITLGVNPSGTLPLIADTVGGSPMKAGPFPGFNANFDMMTLHVDSCEATTTTGGPCGKIDPPAVPVPAAVWLFGSGLVGLVGVARRRRKSV